MERLTSAALLTGGRKTEVIRLFLFTAGTRKIWGTTALGLGCAAHCDSSQCASLYHSPGIGQTILTGDKNGFKKKVAGWHTGL